MDVVNSHTEEIRQELERLSLDAWQVDLSVDLTEPRYTLFQNGTGTIPRGDIIAIKAKSKQGKSFLCSAFIASMFGCEEFSFSCADDIGTILYFDTEQNEMNTAKLARRVHSLMGWATKENNSRFKVYALRKADTKERVKIIGDTIARHSPSVVFVDGVADLIENFNDVTQSAEAINKLMQLSATHDCAIVCVLHENKHEDDESMKGHLGTMLLQKSADVFQIKKCGASYNVTETDCRNMPIEDFSFCIDTAGIPRKGLSVEEIKRNEKRAKLQKAFAECFNGKESLTYSELVKAYELVGMVGLSRAKTCIREARSMGVLECVPNSKYIRLRGT